MLYFYYFVFSPFRNFVILLLECHLVFLWNYFDLAFLNSSVIFIAASCWFHNSFRLSRSFWTTSAGARSIKFLFSSFICFAEINPSSFM